MNDTWRFFTGLPFLTVKLSLSSITPVKRIASFPLGLTSKDAVALSNTSKTIW